jgi:hypothetical protein
MPVGLEHGFGRFTQIVELAQLMGDIGKDCLNRCPDRLLAIRDDSTHRNR